MLIEAEAGYPYRGREDTMIRETTHGNFQLNLFSLYQKEMVLNVMFYISFDSIFKYFDPSFHVI